ncbi:MAG: helix-turn-helix domain-containing protein, partial [Pseudomonadota bacterium]
MTELKQSLHTGARIRDRRLAIGLKQGDLAARAGISASYLNLIEHNKRRIGGKLLNDLSRALGTDPGALTDGPEAALYRALQAAATLAGDGGLPPELDRIDALAARFPGWAATIAAQNRRITALEALNATLGDRLSHDHVLADAIHELLSTVSAIRSTAAILAEDDNLDPQWRARFHRNLHEKAERLSGRATELAQHFDGEAPGQSPPVLSPAEAVERLFDRAGHHFPQIEAEGEAAIPGILAGAEGLSTGIGEAMAVAALTDYAIDAKRLPLGPFMDAARAAEFAPEQLYAVAGGDVAAVLRRLACLPPHSGAPEFGLAVCDAAGALLRRRRHTAFRVPRFGTGCPRLPLYRAFYEHHALTRQAARDPGSVPDLLHFDEAQALIVMEYLADHV